MGVPQPASSTCFQNPPSCPVPDLSGAPLASSPDSFPRSQAQAYAGGCRVSLSPTSRSPLGSRLARANSSPVCPDCDKTPAGLYQSASGLPKLHTRRITAGGRAGPRPSRLWGLQPRTPTTLTARTGVGTQASAGAGRKSTRSSAPRDASPAATHLFSGPPQPGLCESPQSTREGFGIRPSTGRAKAGHPTGASGAICLAEERRPDLDKATVQSEVLMRS